MLWRILCTNSTDIGTAGGMIILIWGSVLVAIRWLRRQGNLSFRKRSLVVGISGNGNFFDGFPGNGSFRRLDALCGGDGFGFVIVLAIGSGCCGWSIQEGYGSAMRLFGRSLLLQIFGQRSLCQRSTLLLGGNSDHIAHGFVFVVVALVCKWIVRADG